jgi:hypothetical protein
VARRKLSAGGTTSILDWVGADIVERCDEEEEGMCEVVEKEK